MTTRAEAEAALAAYTNAGGSFVGAAPNFDTGELSGGFWGGQENGGHNIYMAQLLGNARNALGNLAASAPGSTQQPRNLTQQDFQFYNFNHAPPNYTGSGADAFSQWSDYIQGAPSSRWGSLTDDEIRAQLGQPVGMNSTQAASAIRGAANAQADQLARNQSDNDGWLGDFAPIAQIASFIPGPWTPFAQAAVAVNELSRDEPNYLGAGLAGLAAAYTGGAFDSFGNSYGGAGSNTMGGYPDAPYGDFGGSVGGYSGFPMVAQANTGTMNDASPVWAQSMGDPYIENPYDPGVGNSGWGMPNPNEWGPPTALTFGSGDYTFRGTNGQGWDGEMAGSGTPAEIMKQYGVTPDVSLRSLGGPDVYLPKGMDQLKLLWSTTKDVAVVKAALNAMGITGSTAAKWLKNITGSSQDQQTPSAIRGAMKLLGGLGLAGLTLSKNGPQRSANPGGTSAQGQLKSVAFAPARTQGANRFRLPGFAAGGNTAQQKKQFFDQMRNQYVQGNGGGQSDTIDAKLSPGEYVIDAEAVSALGDGSNAEGAKKLDVMRQNIRQHKRSGPLSQIPPLAKTPNQYFKKGK